MALSAYSKSELCAITELPLSLWAQIYKINCNHYIGEEGYVRVVVERKLEECRTCHQKITQSGLSSPIKNPIYKDVNNPFCCMADDDLFRIWHRDFSSDK